MLRARFFELKLDRVDLPITAGPALGARYFGASKSKARFYMCACVKSGNHPGITTKILLRKFRPFWRNNFPTFGCPIPGRWESPQAQEETLGWLWKIWRAPAPLPFFFACYLRIRTALQKVAKAYRIVKATNWSLADLAMKIQRCVKTSDETRMTWDCIVKFNANATVSYTHDFGLLCHAAINEAIFQMMTYKAAAS